MITTQPRRKQRPHKKQRWSDDDMAVLRARYPHEATDVVAAALGRPATAVQKMAQLSGIGKTPEALSAIKRAGALKVSEAGAAHRFKPVHGRSGTDDDGKKDPVYIVWLTMHQRCTYPKHKSFKDYGGRGITICERWNDFSNFLADMGERPHRKTIGRIDNDGNYEPGNCEWQTHSEQARNRRNTPYLTAFGETKPLLEWAEQYGMRADTLKFRVKRSGYSAECALTTPVSLSSTYRVTKAG